PVEWLANADELLRLERELLVVSRSLPPAPHLAVVTTDQVTEQVERPLVERGDLLHKRSRRHRIALGSDGLQHAGLDEGPDRSQERRMVRPDAMQEVEDREHRRQLVPEPAPLAVALVQAVQLAQRCPRALRRLRQVATLRPRAARVRPDRRLEDGMGLAPVVEARREIEDPREVRRQLQLVDQVEGSLRGLPAV